MKPTMPIAVDDSRWKRRRFLTTGIAAGLCATGLEARQPDKPAAVTAAPGTHPIPTRAFGKNRQSLPVLAFGGSAMVSRWDATYGPQRSFAERVAMVRHAFDSGIRYFDTSPNYTESEAIIGEALHDVRDQVFLATKVGVPPSDDRILKPDQVRESVETSLRRLRTDRLDCIQVHGPAFEYEGFKRGHDLQEELARLRGERICKSIGLTGHNAFETMFRLIDTQLFDQLLIAYGYFPKGMDTILSHTNLAWRERCLSRARELQMGVVAMKVMASFVFGFRAPEIVKGFDTEKLSLLRAAALRWSLADERIDLALVGVSRPEDIDRNVLVVREPRPLNGAERALLAEFTAEAFRSPIITRLKVV